jgi:hypothetical protein
MTKDKAPVSRIVDGTGIRARLDTCAHPPFEHGFPLRQPAELQRQSGRRDLDAWRVTVFAITLTLT